MNVAIFASAFHPSLGGVEELVRQLAHEQQNRGDRPLIFTNRYPKSLPAEEVFEKLPIRRHAFRVPEPNWKQFGGSVLCGPSTARKVCRQLREHAAEIIHVQCVSSNAHYALIAKRQLGLPLVVSLQGELSMDASDLFQRSQFARSLMRTILNEADAITACSGQTLAEAEAFIGRPFGPRGQVVYNGIRLSEFTTAHPAAQARPYLLAIGRHVKQKGFDVLLRAFSQLASQFSGHDLLIAGDGSEHESLKQLAQTIGNGARVIFPGRVDHDAAVSLFAGCTLFVLPSRHEPMGIVNLEAMAAGRAVIATDVGGVPELVQHERTGLLVRPDDSAALATAMTRLLTDAAERDQLGRAGQRRAQQFDWSAIAGQYNAIYQRLCAAGTSQRRAI